MVPSLGSYEHTRKIKILRKAKLHSVLLKIRAIVSNPQNQANVKKHEVCRKTSQ